MEVSMNNNKSFYMPKYIAKHIPFNRVNSKKSWCMLFQFIYAWFHHFVQGQWHHMG